MSPTGVGTYLIVLLPYYPRFQRGLGAPPLARLVPRPWMSASALSHLCAHKLLLFVGDSTMQEVMWTLMLDLGRCSHDLHGGHHKREHVSRNRSCAALDPLNLPVRSCANARCMAMAHTSVAQMASSGAVLLKANSRCFSMSACDAAGRAMLHGARVPFHAEFVWSANEGIVTNGGGLSRSFRSASWRAYFADIARLNATSSSSASRPHGDAARRFAFDAVIFTAGMHDTYKAPQFKVPGPAYKGAVAAYARQLAVALHELSHLAPTRVFLSIVNRSSSRFSRFPLREIVTTVHPNVLRNVSAELVRRGEGGWISALEAAPPGEGDHCGNMLYDENMFGYASTANCTALAHCVGRLLCDPGTASMAAAGHSEVQCR